MSTPGLPKAVDLYLAKASGGLFISQFNQAICTKFEEYHMQYFFRNHCVENSLNCIPFIIYVRSPKEQHKYTLHYLGRSYNIPECIALNEEWNALIVIKKLFSKLFNSYQLAERTDEFLQSMNKNCL